MMERQSWTLLFIGSCICILGFLSAILIDAVQGDPFNAPALIGIACGAILAMVGLSQRKKTPTP